MKTRKFEKGQIVLNEAVIEYEVMGYTQQNHLMLRCAFPEGMNASGFDLILCNDESAFRLKEEPCEPIDDHFPDARKMVEKNLEC